MTLEALSTRPQLTTLMLIGVQKDNENIPIINGCPPNIANILVIQESIGWELLKYGFIAKEWSTAQLEHHMVWAPESCQAGAG